MDAVDLTKPGRAQTRRRARQTRARAKAVRAEAERARRRSEALADALAQNLLRAAPRPLGEHDGRFALRLGRLRPMVRLARHDLSRWLGREGVDAEIVQDVALACSEACANAVEHAADSVRQVFEVEARRDDDELEVVVHDFGRWTDHAKSDTRGRGLGMVDALMDSVELRHDAVGTTLVMRRSLRSPR